MSDLHYTPTTLAEHLISFIEKQDVFSIADFCVGEGELLKAAKKKWTKARLYGCDIAGNTVALMKKEHPDWKLGKCDFLNPRSRRSSTILKNKYDLILLNPPFTCKGATIISVFLDGEEYNMSTAMAFFVEAIEYLKEDGVMYAILPQSIAYSQKDKKIRSYLEKRYNFRILEECNNQEFEKCAPNIVLASINDKNIFGSNFDYSPKQLDTGIDHIEIMRGNISMHKIKEVRKSALFLIHSTNLQNNIITNLKYKVNNINSRIEGPALLIPRVGQPNINKICIISSKDAYALSDCIIALKMKTIEECYSLKELIIKNWIDFSLLFKGTGAKYITLERIKIFFDL